jgi:hypothetical protein
MNFGISIILKKNQLKMSLNFMSQISLQVHYAVPKLIINLLKTSLLIYLRHYICVNKICLPDSL